MDSTLSPDCLAALSSLIPLLLSEMPLITYVPVPHKMEEEDDDDHALSIISGISDAPMLDVQAAFAPALHSWLCNTSLTTALADDLVKPRSTSWFSRFLHDQHDNKQWVKMFRMSKEAVFMLTDTLKPHIDNKNTPYKQAVPVLVRVACTLFKLAHGANLAMCSEMFGVGKSTVRLMLREVVHSINDALRHEIGWPSTSDRMAEIEAKFFQLCGLPGVIGAIDNMRVPISKPQYCPVDYRRRYNTGGYSINCQAVVDSENRFLNIFVGMPGSVSDSRTLCRSSLYTHGQTLNPALNPATKLHGFAPYLLGDRGYPLMPWLMVPHRYETRISLAEVTFNRCLRRGRSAVENAFGILKHTFRELLLETELGVAFLPDVILCCAILHNFLLGQSHDEVEQLLSVLREEGLADERAGVQDFGGIVPERTATAEAVEKRAALGVFVVTQRP